MGIQEAADALRDRLRNAPWVTGVGIGLCDGSPCIYLYVNSPRTADVAFLKNGWQGFRVEIRKMGVIRSG